MTLFAENNVQISEKSIAGERAVAFVVVRLSSSRLPEKQFRCIGNRPLLQWIIENLKTCAELDEIVIATVSEKENEPLRDFSREQGLPCFWYEGEVDHVTTRLRKAAEEFNADICVLVSGDCPLVHAPSIDHLIREARADPDADIIRVLKNDKDNPPALQGIQVARKRAWQQADDLSDRPELKEHQFPIIGKRPDLFKTHSCRLPKDLYSSCPLRLSVDTWADLEFMNTIHDSLCADNRPFSLPDTLALLRRNPALLGINRHVHQMEIGEGRKNVVMVVDAGNGYGYGHLMRSRELAMQITERLGWPVAFVVSDDKAVRLLNDSGLRTTQKIRIPEIKTGGREDGDNSNGFQISEVSSPFDLIILDIYYKRDLGTGWKSMFPCNSKVVVLDHCGEWTKEADLVVIPGVAYNGSRWTKKVGYPRTVGGKHYVILRREIRRLRDRHMKKDIDLLAYLHSSDQKEAVRNLDTGDGLKVHVVQGFDSNFPELLARSRMFLSGFGYSFYEALALGSYPITLPLSDTHRTDAMKFYDRLGLPRGLVESVGEIENTITDLAQRWEKTGSMKTEDGTPRIVEEFASLLRNEQS